MKKHIFIIMIILCLAVMAACTSDDNGKDILNPYFTGEVIEKYEKSCLLKVTDIGNGNFAIGDEVVVTTDISSCPDFEVGDYLTISFDGKVAESYPPQILKVYIISKSEKPQSNEASADDELTDVGGNTGIESTFTKQQYSSDNVNIRYWLYTPENPTNNMPLIVYLHGGSGKGDNLELITSVDGFPQYLLDGKLTPNAYVIIPQVSSEYKGWGDNKADVMKLISFVSEEYDINEDKISLTGHSMGGSGAWMLALAYPNTFSAVAPLSGSVKLTDANINKLKNIPVWAIVGAEDTIVDPQSSIDFIAELAAVNEKAKLTELEGADHFAVPNLSYLSNEFNLIEWLLSQTK